MTADADRNRKIAAARPADHAWRIEASRVRLSESRRICQSTAVIIRETQVSIERALQMLGIDSPRGSRKSSIKGSNLVFAARISTAGCSDKSGGDEGDGAVDSE